MASLTTLPIPRTQRQEFLRRETSSSAVLRYHKTCSPGPAVSFCLARCDLAF